jgi:DNA modification methylase
MARRIELWPVEELVPYGRNARTHSDAQVAQIAASIAEFGFNNPILVDTGAGIIAGHGRLLAARKLGLEHVPVVVLDHLTETQKRAYILADNKLAEQAGWDEGLLRDELADLREAEIDLEVLGFSEEELRALLAEPEAAAEETASAPEEIPEAPVEPVTRAGDIWAVGRHRLICGDCRDLAVVKAVLDGAAVNVAITSPPYATQREYDPASGFKPVPPDEYVDWFRAVADNVEAVLAADGSWFVNIKAHAEDGERSLYVMDLVLAHKRAWGWRFVDDLLWRKTDNGVPGGWPNRFKNAHEPVFHFCRQAEIKFRPKSVGHVSDGCFDYSPDTPKSNSGSGLLGDHDGRYAGIARPSNVIECTTESTQGSHSAPYPRALVEFFVKAFSDEGDVVLDPFMGSGTTMAAAHVLNRVGYGCEISPAYCDVILRRIAALAETEPVLVETGESMAAVAAARGVPVEQALNPKQKDSRAIKHRGPNPFYGAKRAS